MTSHPSENGAGDNRQPAAPHGDTPTQPLPPHGDNPTQPLPPHGDNPTQPLPPPAPAGQPQGFFAWIRSLGIVRGSDRWVGGVASGIAARTGLDPTLVRGILVVLGLFGVGTLLYGLAWAFLPEPDGRIHAEEAVRGTWSTGTTGALVACILGAGSPSIFWADDGLLGGLFWTLFWLTGAGLLVYWLTTRSHRTDTVKGAAAKDKAFGQAPPAYDYSASHPYPAKPAPDMPYPDRMAYPAPGTAYPDRPAPVPVPAKPRTTPTGSQIALVLGAVLLGLGTVLALDYASLIDLDSPVAAALAAAAVVNGLGIVVLGAMGRSSGVLGLTAVVALIGAGVAGTNLGTYANVVVANQADWTPDRSHPATEGYTLAAVDGQLDLRYLSNESRSGVVVPVSVAASDLTILVPDDIPVLIRTDMLAGNVEIDDGVSVTESGSIWRSSDQRLNDAGGEPVVVHIKGVASNVLVTVNESDLDR